MRRYTVGDLHYNTLQWKLDRRVAISQIEAAKAQVRSAGLQVLGVIAMFLAVVATLAAAWIAQTSHYPMALSGITLSDAAQKFAQDRITARRFSNKSPRR